MKIKFSKYSQSLTYPNNENPGFFISMDKSKKTIELLKNHQVFNDEVNRIKDKFRIPNEGHIFEKIEDMGKAGQYIELGLDNELKCLMEKMDWNINWRVTALMLVVFNEFYPPDDEPIDTLTWFKINPDDKSVLFYPEDTSDTVIQEWLKKRYTLLAITRKMSQREFISQIKHHWPKIKKGMELLPSNEDLPRNQETEFLNEALVLHEKEKMSYKQICELLEKKYPDFQVQYNTLGKKLRAWKKHLKDS